MNDLYNSYTVNGFPNRNKAPSCALNNVDFAIVSDLFNCNINTYKSKPNKIDKLDQRNE